jgi:hypothetical protein
MDTSNPNMLEAIYRLTKENNEMLRAERRGRFLGGLFRFVFYGVLILAPLWYYMTYLHPTVQSLLETTAQLQGMAGGSAAQGGGFVEQLKQLQAMVPGALEKLQQAQQASSTVQQ